MSNNQTIFNNATLYFHNATAGVNSEQIPLPISDSKFGILKLDAVITTLCEECQEFVFTVDRSGSMSDQCSDKRSKMQHTLHTLKNMIAYFKDNSSIKAIISINTFDNIVESVLGRTIVTKEKFQDIIESIDTIIPRGSTNIEKALNETNHFISQIKKSFPDHTINHIFMTDGEATMGNKDHQILASIVDRSVTNTFIGFGIDHDSLLLNTISSGENSSYYFVDKIENAGLVYGEILHSILYKLLKNVVINIENGLIYDFKNNLWVSSLSVGDIVSESSKIYNIVSSSPEECIATLNAKRVLDLSEIKISIKGEIRDEDFTKYIYRQRTLQQLYIVNDFLKRKNDKHYSTFTLFTFRDNETDDNKPESFREEENKIKIDLINFMDEMKDYMMGNRLMEDNFMKNLCDDIYICHRTFTTRYGSMYVGARQTSQGTQRCYTVTNTPIEKPSAPRLARHIANSNLYFSNIQNLDQENEDFMKHEVSGFDDAPYLTPGSSRLMREISSSNRQDTKVSSKDLYYISSDSEKEELHL
jgi:hypothetical protein